MNSGAAGDGAGAVQAVDERPGRPLHLRLLAEAHFGAELPQAGQTDAGPLPEQHRATLF